jgi:hypothetical protein
VLAKDEILEYERLCKSFRHCEATIAALRKQGCDVDSAEQFLGCMRDAEHAIRRWRDEQSKAMKLRAAWMLAKGLSEEEIAEYCDPEKYPTGLREEEENLRASETLRQMPSAQDFWSKHTAGR